jgi:TolA-binding protein
MSKPGAVTLIGVCAAALVIGALVARGGPRSGDGTRKPDVATPAPAAASAAPTERRPAEAQTPAHDAEAVATDARPPALTAKQLAAMVNEAALMVRLHQLAETDPPLSLRLAREGNARFPHTPDAAERAFIVVKSLVDMTRFKEAQDEARKMLKDYPNDPHTLDVERHLLSNPLQ